MKRVGGILAVAMCLAGVAALAEGLLGTWAITTENPEGPTESELIVTKTEDGYAGNITGPRGTADLWDISMDDTSFSFGITMETHMGAIDLHYTGTIDSDTLRGNIATPFDDRPTTGMRKGAAADDE